MSGYIGTKSVTLSTTSANVGGDSTVGGDLTVDTNTLYVDSTNNRVGVGTASPSNPFQVGTSDLIVDSSGNVGIGTSSPNQPLTVVTNSSAQGINIAGRSSDNRAYMFFSDNNGTTYRGSIHTIPADNRFNINAYSGENITFSNNGAEKVRIDSSGNLLVGKTVLGVTDTGVSIADDASGRIVVVGNYNDYLLRFQNLNGGTRGSIILNSNGTVSYNTSSDYRLKENVVELTGATDRLKQLEPKRFNFIANADDTPVDGFLAHEVQTVVPEAIHGTKDEVDADGNPVYQGIDQSKLVPLLVATIKELEARITALETV